jgi:predicted ATPase with chaperone activity
VARSYLARLSGPVLDRIDLPVLLREEPGERTTGQGMRESVRQGRDFALKRFGTLPSRMMPSTLEIEFERPDLKFLFDSAPPSLRFRHKTLRVAKSIQALEQTPRLEPHQVMEALALRDLESHL